MVLKRLSCCILLAILVGGSIAQEPNPEQPAPEPEAPLDLKLGLMPKHETGALRFMDAHPEFDGRGTVVAIFDTGVDPGAAGLQTTSHGQPKVIDLVDATGSGDVEMSVVAKPVDGKVTGRTGRVLKLGADWKIPAGEVRLGMKAGFELFPLELLPRLKKHRKDAFLEVQHKLEAEMRREIEHYDTKTSKVEKAELERRLERLVAAGQSIEDVGPIFDCVVFHDGTHWRAAVDTDEDGDLAEEKLLTNFRTERQYATFDGVSLLNFAANIYDNGKTLSIVIDSNPHGTHVAGIVAANFPDQPEWNGVAPGAQIVSVKIGDTYLEGMETPAGLLRAVKAVLDNKCDLINMSFGEPTKTPDRGFVVKLYDELVDKHGVIFLSSAGNAGPALSTVGAPGGTTTSIIGVGAYVSPEMMAAQYALRERLGETAFSWTSRGPTFDGDLGVNLFAPGAAIAPVPAWTLNRSMRMNGTSMASPNCCGNFALALSGLKQMKVKYSPNSVERAFANTARRIESSDVFAQGAGLIQVDAAFEALVRDAEKKAEQQRFDIKLQPSGARGIYLREPLEVGEFCEPREYVVSVSPTFNDNATSTEKFAFQLRCTLESTADWLHCGEQVTLTSSGQTLNVLVDPRGLEPGAHFAEVLGFDADDHDRGPLFRIPVTICRTVPVVRDDAEVVPDVPTLRGQQLNETIHEFGPGRIERRFIPVPSGAAWVDLKIKQTPREHGGRSRLFMLHAVQVITGQSYRDAERNQPTPLQAGIEVVQSFPVEPGRTLELAIAQFWSSLGTCDVEYELLFRGLSPDQRDVRLTPSDIAARVEIRSEYEPEHVAPVAKLTSIRHQHKPTNAVIKSASPDRDNFDPSRAFEVLTLSYEFDQPEPGSITPRFGATDDLLYDSEYGGVLWTIHDANGRRVGTDDVYPHAVSLAKGKHTLKLELRHYEHAKLEAMKSLQLTIERGIGAIQLPVFTSMADAQQHGTRFAARTLLAGERTRAFIGNVSKGQLPAGAQPGDVLVGTITYGGESTHRGAGDRPGGYPLTVTVSATDASLAGSSGSNRSADAEPLWISDDATSPKTPEEKIARAVRDAKRQLLHATSFDADRALFDKLAEDLLKETPNDLTVLVSKLRKLDASAKRDDNLEEVIAAADAVLAQLNANDIAIALAIKPAAGDADAAKKRKQAEALKPLLIDTLYRKGRAIGHQELPEVIAKKPIADPKAYGESFEKNFAELQRWVDTTDATYFLLHMRRASRQGHYGESLQLLDRHFSRATPNYWHLEKRRELLEKLNWPHLTAPALRSRLLAFPNGEPK